MESVEERLKELTAVVTDFKSKMDEQQDQLLQIEREKIEMNNAEEAEKEDQEGKKDQWKGKWNKGRVWSNRGRNQWKGNWRGRRGKGYTFVFK